MVIASRIFKMKKVFSICEDCRSKGIEEFDLLVTNDTHETCHACNSYVEVFGEPTHLHLQDVEVEVVHKGFAGILHFWSVRDVVYPETIYTPEQELEINRQESGGTSFVRRLLNR